MRQRELVAVNNIIHEGAGREQRDKQLEQRRRTEATEVFLSIPSAITTMTDSNNQFVNEVATT